LNVQFVGLNIV